VLSSVAVICSTREVEEARRLTARARATYEKGNVEIRCWMSTVDAVLGASSQA
jgi:hypothetical protein